MAKVKTTMYIWLIHKQFIMISVFFPGSMHPEVTYRLRQNLCHLPPPGVTLLRTLLHVLVVSLLQSPSLPVSLCRGLSQLRPEAMKMTVQILEKIIFVNIHKYLFI